MGFAAEVGHVIQGLFCWTERTLKKAREKCVQSAENNQYDLSGPNDSAESGETVGEQIAEVVYLHDRCSKADA